jgi:hypothetical protein
VSTVDSGYLRGVTSESFDAAQYLLALPPRVVAVLTGQEGTDDDRSKVRRALSERDPLMFALLYLRTHLRMKDSSGVPFGGVSMSDFHLDLCRDARAEIDGELPQLRHVRVAPRESGKSTWHFLILPLWRGAFLHSNFEAAFSDVPAQAEQHLRTMRQEMDENPVLRKDFPSLCAPRRRSTGITIADNQRMIQCANGWTFAARGILGGVLGLKVGSNRPERLILDDIEPVEENYSDYQARQRLSTLTEAILPLGWQSRVDIVGTVTMPGSIIHQLVKHGRGEVDSENTWCADENFEVHHYLPIVESADGTERSAWPDKWALPDLLDIRHTRSYAKNYANDPLARDGAYWTLDDIAYAAPPRLGRTVLFVDGAVTKKNTSDRTGLAVWRQGRDGSLCLLYARGVRKTNEDLRQEVLNILALHPETERIVVENNNGGDLWYAVFHNMPVPVRLVDSAEVYPGPKEVRFARALAHYQAMPRNVTHAGRFPDAEAEMVSFPHGRNDDVADAVVMGVLIFRERPRARKAQVMPSLSA